MAGVQLTRRALLDLDEIDRYSVQNWGERVAGQYLEEINSALMRLQESPSLLKERPDYSLRLRFYRVRKHTLICDVIGSEIYILAVWHGSMDLPRRVAKLEPQLIHEAELMHRRIIECGD